MRLWMNGHARTGAGSSSIFVLALLFLGTPAAAQITAFPVSDCLAGKLSAVGKSVAARAICHSKDAKSGAMDPACLLQASAKFNGSGDPGKSPFAKLEAKHPLATATPCLTFLDVGTFEERTAQLAASLSGMTGAGPSKCDAAKIKCVGKYLGALAKCDSKSAASGDPLTECAAAAAAKLAGFAKGCLEKAASGDDCTHAGSQAVALQSAADAYVEDVRCSLSPDNEGCLPQCAPYPFAADYSSLAVLPAATAVASNKDWRTQGAVTPVKNQGQCGSDGAFSVTGALEGFRAISTAGLVSLSEQQIVDCAPTDGCSGISPPIALSYLQSNGSCGAASYPYTARDGTCRVCTPVVNGNFAVGRIPTADEASLKAYVELGPVAAVIRGGNWLETYHGNIADPDCDVCATDEEPTYTAVLVVGYGEEAGVPYWLLKLSWGTSFGTSGYVRLRGDRNACGIADYALSVGGV